MVQRFGVAAAAVLLVAASASAALALTRGHESKRACTWGASSIAADYANGRWVVSRPSVSGCTNGP